MASLNKRILELLAEEPGFELSLYGCLTLRQVRLAADADDEEEADEVAFAVTFEQPGKRDAGWEETFDTPHAAVAYFLQKAKESKLI